MDANLSPRRVDEPLNVSRWSDESTLDTIESAETPPRASTPIPSPSHPRRYTTPSTPISDNFLRQIPSEQTISDSDLWTNQTPNEIYNEPEEFFDNESEEQQSFTNTDSEQFAEFDQAPIDDGEPCPELDQAPIDDGEPCPELNQAPIDDGEPCPDPTLSEDYPDGEQIEHENSYCQDPTLTDDYPMADSNSTLTEQ